MADWSKIVPSILDKAPPELFEIRYPAFDIKLGQKIKPGDILAPPVFVNWPNIEPEANYVMSLVDCDPNNTDGYEYKQVNLGLSVNIPGGLVTKGFVAAPYAPPMPKEGTGVHRYLVTVFKQSALIKNVPFAVDDISRHNFDIRKFAKDHNLNDPIAGIYFLAEGDETTQQYWSQNIQFGKAASANVSFSCVIS